MKPLDVLAALEAAGDKATQGEWHGTRGEIECDQCGETAYLCDLTSHAEDDTPYESLRMQLCGLESLCQPNEDFIVKSANARPALKAHLAAVARLVEAARAVVEGSYSMPGDCHEVPYRLIDVLRDALKEVDRDG